MSVEAFVITNQRSTLKFTLKSLENQSMTIKTTVISGMKWIDAVNRCVELCQSDYYFRVDDDMFLHPACLEYMYGQGKGRRDMAAYLCKLWEDWQNKIAGFIKLYDCRIVKRMGGFACDSNGKVDKPFNRNAAKKGFRICKDSSVVGMHACGTWEECEQYRAIWKANNNGKWLTRPKNYLKAQQKYGKSAIDQYLLLPQVLKRNSKTSFLKFAKKRGY